MDPTRTFCRVDFNTTPENCREITTGNVKMLVLDKSVTSLIKNKNVQYNQALLIKGEEYYDPFTVIPAAPFKNIDAYNLASLDLYFTITDHSSGLIAPQLLKFQNYIISGSTNLGMAEYLQYRNVLTFMYFFEVLDPKVYETNINVDRMLEVIDRSNLKSRYINYDFYITKVLNLDSSGVDCFISQNHSSDIDLLCQIVIMLNTLKFGGTTIIKVILSDLISDVILILSNLFDSVTLFKTCTLGLYNNEYYLIGKHYKQKIIASRQNIVISLFKDIVKRGDYYQNVDFILQNKNESVEQYIGSIQELVDAEKINDSTKLYVTDKLKMYLNIQ